MHRVTALVMLAIVTGLAAAGEAVSQAQQKPAATSTDWPQWRGPRRDGSIAVALPAQWPAALKKRWETPVGTGHPSFAARETDCQVGMRPLTVGACPLYLRPERRLAAANPIRPGR